MKKKLMVLVAMLAMLLVAAAYAWSAEFYPMQTTGSIVIPGEPSGDELLCFIPEGCDMNNDGVPDLRAGEPVPNQNVNTGFEQYKAV